MPQPPSSPLIEAMDFHELRGRVGTIEQVVQRIEQATSSIADSLQTLARLEERHAEVRTSLTVAWSKIDDQRDELAAVKEELNNKITTVATTVATELPPLKETRKWVVAGLLASVGMMGAALIGLVLQIPH